MTGGRGVGTAASERQTVVASAGQATSAQKHSEALIDVLQEMAFCRISQQQQASGLVGAARVSELDRARKRFVRRIARFLFLMKRRKKSGATDGRWRYYPYSATEEMTKARQFIINLDLCSSSSLRCCPSYSPTRDRAARSEVVVHL